MSNTVRRVQLFPIIGGGIWLVLVYIMIALIVNSCNKTPEGKAPAPEQDSQTAENNKNANGLSPSQEKEYLERGMQVVKTSGQKLLSEVKSGLERGGVKEALKYCNVKAIPLVDSLSFAQKAKIRRTSLKFRNPVDAPLGPEKDMLEYYAQLKEAGERIGAEIRKTEAGDIAFYHPIIVQKTCLKCHGELGKGLSAPDYEAIVALYPKDQATGYEEGDLRGMWSLVFD